jgi:bacterioferritin
MMRQEAKMNEKSIELLNRAVAGELTAVNRYLYFHFHLGAQGLQNQARMFRQAAIDEMRHVDRLAERILALRGDVEMVPSGNVEKIRDAKAMLKLASEMEHGAVRDYELFSTQCAANGDAATEDIFLRNLADEKRHLGQYDDELAKLR